MKIRLTTLEHWISQLKDQDKIEFIGSQKGAVTAKQLGIGVESKRQANRRST